MDTDKYFNELIKRIENPLEFNILISLSELVENLSNAKKIELDDKLKIIGVSKKYFDIINDTTGWYSLSESGIELKESNKPYKKFEKRRKSKPMTNFQKWSLFLLIATPISGIFYQNKSLKSDYSTLKFQSESYKDSIVKLKERLEMYEEKTLKKPDL
jgi:hypothetical protein